MDKAETRDFMNVDSFSQLPFIRPAPPKDKPVRLFGIEFQNSAAPEGTENQQNSDDTITQLDVQTKDISTTTTTSDTAHNNTGSSGRKFECHYCCRNFPTSQALGGHQNAHKRERQHAKRAYLQSAAMLHPAADHHLYGGVLGYHHRMGPTHLPYSSSSSSWSNSFSNTTTTTTSTNYHTSLSRYYPSSSSYHSYPSHHHHHHHQPPINGSPLAMWRIPSVQAHSGSSNRDRSLLQHQYPPPLPSPHPPLPFIDNSKASPQTAQYVLDPKKGFQDHVSLDLHL